MRNGFPRRLAERLGAIAGALAALTLATSAQAYGGEGTVEPLYGNPAASEYTIQYNSSAGALQSITIYEGAGGIQGIQLTHLMAVPDPVQGRNGAAIFPRATAVAGKAEGKRTDLTFAVDTTGWNMMSAPRKTERIRLVIAYFEGAHLVGLEFGTDDRTGLMLGRKTGATYAATMAAEEINLLLGFNIGVGSDGVITAIGLIHDFGPLPAMQITRLTGAPTTVRPGEQYAGCPLPTRPASNEASHPAGEVADATSGMIFASMSYDDVASGAADQALRGDQKAACWFRLDGVWGRSDLFIDLDESKNDPNWAGELPKLAELTNGNYTTLPFYVIETTPGTDDEITLIPALDPAARFTMRSTDGLPLSKVLAPYGNPPPPAKTYVGGGKTAVLRVERGGQIWFTLDGVVFRRPVPGITKKEITAEDRVARTDPFLLSYTIENSRASRVGYDITTADPILIANNTKQEVFENVEPKAYYFNDRYVVPLGFTLIQRPLSGTIFSKTTIASEREVQNTVASTYGASVGYGQKDAKGNTEKGASIAVEYATSSAVGSKNEDIAQMAFGMARVKKYALVVDYPYIRLHANFLAAIERARREGTKDAYDYIIHTYGTHYPYAVTYGAAAYAAQSFKQETVAAWAVEGKSVSVQVQGVMKGVEANAKYSRSQETASKESNQFGVEQTEFLAINSSGSWSEHGFQADHNTGYPILLDLRPLDELLNPIYFADEPEVVTIVRPKLHAAIQSYLNSRPKASDVSKYPEVWRFTANKLTCVTPPFDGLTAGIDIPAFLALERTATQNLKGSLNVTFITPQGMKAVSPIYPFKTDEGVTKPMDCTTHGSVDLVAGASTTLWGTHDQIAATKFMFLPAIFEEDSKAEDFFRSDGVVGDDPTAILPSPMFPMPSIKTARIATAHITGEYQFPKLSPSAPVIKLEYTLDRIQ